MALGPLATRLSGRFRERRNRLLRSQIAKLASGKTQLSIVDLGGSELYWRNFGLDFLREHRCRICLINAYESELRQSSEGDLFEYVVADVCSLPFIADNQYDIAHSNSVVEHLETWSNMKAFAAEARRIAPAHYVQTPNFWFPIDPHYYRFPLFHWLPRPLRAWLLHRLPIAHAGRVESWDAVQHVVDSSRLLSRRQLEVLFPGSTIHRERLLGLVKSFTAVGPG